MTPDRSTLVEKLEGEVLALRSSAKWASYLEAQSRFHLYSPRNVMLIAMQNPNATRVAGFTTWRRLGRTVKKGERALTILAPVMGSNTVDDSPCLTGFRWVNVFDVDQTFGEPLPSPVEILSSHAPEDLESSLRLVAQRVGFSLTYEPLPSGVNGECRWVSRTIVIDPNNPELQRIKTIVHELGHGLLHEREPNRSRAEIEAESVAYVVLAVCGLNAAPYSAGYVASWIDNLDELSQVIQHSLGAIQRATTTILSSLERLIGDAENSKTNDRLDQGVHPLVHVDRFKHWPQGHI